MNIKERITSAIADAKKIGQLYVEGLRLKATEKLAIFLATVAFYAVMALLGLVLLIFVSLGVGHLLATTIAPHWAYLLVAAFYLLLMVLVAIFKRRIFGDPIARFLSLLFIDDPNPSDKDEPSDTTDQPGKNTRP
jgi:hypothetical protein